MPYKYEIIFEKVYDAKEALRVENILHKALYIHRYTPILKFDGSSKECYSKIENYETIIQKGLEK